MQSTLLLFLRTNWYLTIFFLGAECYAFLPEIHCMTRGSSYMCIVFNYPFIAQTLALFYLHTDSLIPTGMHRSSKWIFIHLFFMHVMFCYAKLKNILIILRILCKIVDFFFSSVKKVSVGKMCVIGGCESGNLSPQSAKWFIVGWGIVKREGYTEGWWSGAD